MKTSNLTPQTQELNRDELIALQSIKHPLIPGRAYLVTCTFGWGFIGFFVENMEPMCVWQKWAHVSHFRSANKHYGKIATEGIPLGEEAWQSYGHISMISVMQIIKVDPYYGDVPRAKVLAPGLEESYQKYKTLCPTDEQILAWDKRERELALKGM